MPSDFIEFINVVGGFAFCVITAMVILMLLISLLDQHPGPESELKANEDTESGKP